MQGINCEKKDNYSIKDVVHDYVNLLEIDVKIIDSIQFQRLKDVKQLTSETVYPSSNHTRFEHSLGVMELCRQAVKHLARNTEKIFLENVDWCELWINSGLAGLLHDIGHLPQSHLGESMYEITGDNQFNVVVKRIISAIEVFNQKYQTHNIFCSNDSLDQDMLSRLNKHQSLHEMISVVLILEVYSKLLIENDADIELIIRAILGYLYCDQSHWAKNVVINLLNSKTIDMDKLDYIMRDAYYTGVSIPPIDTKRLFKNMTIHHELKTITYKAGAISVIQNIIEARNNLYFFVYNHHVSIYTEFLSNYFLRTMNKAFLKCVLKDTWDNEDLCYSDFAVLDVNFYCSIDSIEKKYISDADLLHLMKKKYLALRERKGCVSCIHHECEIKQSKLFEIQTKIGQQIYERVYLKPVWKTIFEFNLFMNQNFADENIRNEVVNKICSDDYQFRAKLVEEMISNGGNEFIELDLTHGDLYIIPRSNRFYTMDNIKQIFIYVKSSAIMSKDEKDVYTNQLFTDVIPQRNFDDLYSRKHFYLYCTDEIRRNKNLFQQFINNFVQTAKRLVTDS
ncbi:HD domain-containing protein [Eubacteriaceae bacterium ES3]|nr:HD domain-containing protein [Eubacteriaceae bacterium ES3]